MKKFLGIIIAVVFFSITAMAQADLLPMPQSYKVIKSSLKLSKISVDSPVLQDEIAEFIAEAGGVIDPVSRTKLSVVIVDSIPGAAINQREAYTLNVTSRGVKIEATTSTGAYWALQTLYQLGTKKGAVTTYSGADIVDWPAFPVRGYMFDVGRTYMEFSELKEIVKVLSRYKINMFMWHLTQYQSWRMESVIFPMLNDSINTSRMPGDYYTHAEAREMIELCKKHHMLLIPEFDMPGHSTAFRNTFRHDMQTPQGKAILKLVMDELCEVFKDVPYINIGTDEVKFVDKNFVPEMVQFLRDRGKKVTSWMPGWTYKAGEIDMQHLWSYRAHSTPGIPATDSKLHYLNHYDTFGDIVGLYTSRVYDLPQGTPDIIGAMMAVWNDRWIKGDWNILIENNFYPNMLAFAERLWQGGGIQYFDDFGTMLESVDSPQYKMFADFERRMLNHKDRYFEGQPFAYVKQTHAKWMITDQFPNQGDLDKVFEPENEIKETYTHNGKEYGTKEAIGSGIYLRHVWGEGTIPGFYEKPLENHTAYAYTWVYSPKTQEVGAWIETQNFSRSEQDLPPAQGKWDEKGSRIWINGEEIMPPHWTTTHTERTWEKYLGNENAVGRKPTMVTLQKGWNKIFLKLPVGKFHVGNPRLTKWMFSVAFVGEDGVSEIPGLVYSTEEK